MMFTFDVLSSFICFIWSEFNYAFYGELNIIESPDGWGMRWLQSWDVDPSGWEVANMRGTRVAHAWCELWVTRSLPRWWRSDTKPSLDFRGLGLEKSRKNGRHRSPSGWSPVLGLQHCCDTSVSISFENWRRLARIYSSCVNSFVSWMSWGATTEHESPEDVHVRAPVVSVVLPLHVFFSLSIWVDMSSVA